MRLFISAFPLLTLVVKGDLVSLTSIEPSLEQRQDHRPLPLSTMTIITTPTSGHHATTTYTTLNSSPSYNPNGITQNSAPPPLTTAGRVGIAFAVLIFLLILVLSLWAFRDKVFCRCCGKKEEEEELGELEKNVAVEEVEEKRPSGSIEEERSVEEAAPGEESPRLAVERYESLHFNVDEFSSDEDAILPVAKEVSSQTAPTPCPTPVRHVSQGSVVWTRAPSSDEQETPVRTQEPSLSNSRLPLSLTPSRPPSSNWPLVDSTPSSPPSLEREASMTAMAAPGYTCPAGYTPSKYRPSPPGNLRPTSLVQGDSVSTFNGSPEKSEYHDSPPPTLPGTARPLSLQQEYSTAFFPASPSPATGTSDVVVADGEEATLPKEAIGTGNKTKVMQDGKTKNRGWVPMPLDLPLHNDSAVEVCADSPSPSSAVTFALAAMALKNAEAESDDGKGNEKKITKTMGEEKVKPEDEMYEVPHDEETKIKEEGSEKCEKTKGKGNDIAETEARTDAGQEDQIDKDNESNATPTRDYLSENKTTENKRTSSFMLGLEKIEEKDTDEEEHSEAKTDENGVFKAPAWAYGSDGGLSALGKWLE